METQSAKSSTQERSLPRSAGAVLRQEFERRVQRKRSYSLRSFARDIGVAPSNLSLILKDRKGISANSAKEISQLLGFNDYETELFVELAKKDFSRSPNERQMAEKRLVQLHQRSMYHAEDLEKFNVIGDWVHSAILELAQLPGFSDRIDWISSTLRQGQGAVKEAFQRLVSLKLLSRNENGSWDTEKAQMPTSTQVPIRHIRERHQQLLDEAKASMENNYGRKTFFESEILAIPSERLPEARQALIEFRQRFCTELRESNNRDSVYCFSTQFFPLTDSSEAFLHNKDFIEDSTKLN